MVQSFFCLIGGLGLFLYGMTLMSDGLKKAAGSKIRDFLNTLVKNRVAGVLLGLGVTAVIQSSSATTVFVVSLTNAGLMTLKQAIPVILGADIGTTATAWLVSFFAVFKITSYALPAIAVGFLIHTLVSKRKISFWGQTILGFGLLFLGLSFMKDAFEPFQNNESMKSFIKVFSTNPLAGVLAGTIITMLMQSSSASIAIVQVMAFSGLISFSGAVYLVLGDNIGTTITAQLAAIRTNRAGRESANAHTMIKVIGVGWIMPIVWFGWYQDLIDFIVPGVISKTTIMAHIAAAHTVFNLANTIVLLPFVSLIEKTVDKITWKRVGELEIADLGLDSRLLYESPHLAIDQAKRGIVEMLTIAQTSLEASLKYLYYGNLADLKKVESREDVIDHHRDEIAVYLARLAEQDIGPHVSETIILLQHSVSDAEKIGDHAVRIVEQRSYMPSGKIEFSDSAQIELARIAEIVWEMIGLTITAVMNNDKEVARQALEREHRLTIYQQEFRRNHMDRLQQGICKVDAGIVFLEVLNRLRGVGGHLANINQFILSSFRLP